MSAPLFRTAIASIGTAMQRGLAVAERHELLARPGTMYVYVKLFERSRGRAVDTTSGSSLTSTSTSTSKRQENPEHRVQSPSNLRPCGKHTENLERIWANIDAVKKSGAERQKQRGEQSSKPEKSETQQKSI